MEKETFLENVSFTILVYGTLDLVIFGVELDFEQVTAPGDILENGTLMILGLCDFLENETFWKKRHLEYGTLMAQLPIGICDIFLENGPCPIFQIW